MVPGKNSSGEKLGLKTKKHFVDGKKKLMINY
jgi:hypothetical protein